MANLVVTVLTILSLLCSNVLSFMDMDELKSVYYGLDILSDPVIITQDLPVGAVQVTSKFGQQYQCTFPNHSLDERRKEEEEKIAIETGIVEMLKPMKLNDCLFKSKDWWSYEFCFGKYIRQFHMEDGEIKGNIIYLGYYHEDYDWNNETAREERLKSKSTFNRYHSQMYTLGTKCDLTEQMRRAEVRFICEENSEDYLSRVDESETCVYTVTVVTSRICRHPYLKAPAKRKAVPITCNPLLSIDEFQDYVHEKEVKQRKEEALKAAAKDALSKEDFSKRVNWDQDLSKTLENEISTSAKELLLKQFSELLSKDGTSQMSKEDFQKKHGNDETTWLMYQKGLKLSKLEEERRKLMAQLDKEEAGSKDDERGEKEETDDDEILSQFDEEINTIKAKFQTSQNKLSNIERKLTIERHWESEIENAIKEAEDELGVKVDRSLVSGLSNTLDKLVNTLHDTQRELSSMDKEIGKLKPGKTILRNEGIEDKDNIDKDELLSDKMTNVNEEQEEEEEEDVAGVEQTDDTFEDDKTVVVNKHEVVGVVKPSYTGDHARDPHDKIQAPPKLVDKSQATPSLHFVGFDEDPDKEADDNTQGIDDETNEDGINGVDDKKTDIEITVKNIESSDVDLPKGVQKLLEESVRKELEKHKQQTDPQDLGFDSDHSFNRDKTVHIIQQEDEDGKTNRFIFVFGFNTFNDESAEKEKQSSLEDNYSFVYNRKRDKNTISA